MRVHKDMCAALEPMGRPPWLETLDLRRSVADLRREKEVSTCQYLTHPEFHEQNIPTGVPPPPVLRSRPCRSACECLQPLPRAPAQPYGRAVQRAGGAGGTLEEIFGGTAEPVAPRYSHTSLLASCALRLWHTNS